MITIELMGGLGNQLFQIFAVIGYSYRFFTPFFFETKEISIGWRKIQYWDTFLSALRPYLRPTQVNLGYRDPHFHHSEIPYLGIEDVKLIGYFQSYKYFDEYKNEIFELIELEKRKTELRQKLAIDSENTISMHFRMGDYKKIQEHHPILTLNYYESALNSVCNSSGKINWTVLYICEEEDITSVNETINELRYLFPYLKFIKLDGGYADWEQMLAMSLCRHHIIANSTFSWFGAYFDTRSDKLVYYPSVWFGPGQGAKNMDDLFPEEWRKIPI
jgi:hypothetical protein